MTRRLLGWCAVLLLGCDEKRAEVKPATPEPVKAVADVVEARPGDDVKRGEYLATIAACHECHTPRLPPTFNELEREKLMAGGNPFAGPWGTVHTANVSMVAARYEPALLEAAIRGQLSFKFQMPTDLYAELAADDMRDLVAYLQSLKPIDVPSPENSLVRDWRPPPPLAARAVRERAPIGVTVERGEYLVHLAICKDCHSPRTADGVTYDEAHRMAGGGVAIRMGKDALLLPPNLTNDVETGLGGWTDEEIITAFRTGKAKSGRTLHPAMPWAVAYKDMTDDDARAIVKYLRSLPPVRRVVARLDAQQLQLAPFCCVEVPTPDFREGKAP
jgi:mono/diheme cytochrome c family protein